MLIIDQNGVYLLCANAFKYCNEFYFNEIKEKINQAACHKIFQCSIFYITNLLSHC